MKLKYILLVSVFSVMPLASIAGDIVEHPIVVPQEYAWGRSQEPFVGTSPIERYVAAYEKTWWRVMRAFVHGPESWEKHGEFICSGTPAESDACINAYEDARKRIEAWVKLSSEEEVKKIVKKHLSK